MRLFGARVVLNDTSNPIPSTVSGSLTTEPRFAGSLAITLNASDTGSGVYRVLVLVDDQLAAATVVDGNGGACADVNPGNSDAYEFGSQTPCKSAAGGTFTFDSSQLPDGAHNLKVQVTPLSRGVHVNVAVRMGPDVDDMLPTDAVVGLRPRRQRG